MRKMLLLAATAAAALVSTVAEAATFVVNGSFTNNANGQAAGTLNGQFTTNDAMTALTSYSLTSQQSGVFESIVYSNSTATVAYGGLPGTNLSGAAFTISSTLTGNVLTLQFPVPLVSPSTALGPLSGESQRRSGIFFDTRSLSGTITAVPEPATWAMMMLGFVLVGAAARRRTVSVTYA